MGVCNHGGIAKFVSRGQLGWTQAEHQVAWLDCIIYSFDWKLHFSNTDGSLAWHENATKTCTQTHKNEFTFLFSDSVSPNHSFYQLLCWSVVLLTSGTMHQQRIIINRCEIKHQQVKKSWPKVARGIEWILLKDESFFQWAHFLLDHAMIRQTCQDRTDVSMGCS